MQPYTQALKRAVTPGCTVLDLGAGTGIFALLACKYGAGKVYAIETNDSVMLARTIAEANGCADKIIFMQELSTEVTLPEKVDVVIADLRGVLPLYDGNIESMIDARDRFLAPGGCLIPQKDKIFAAVSSAPDSFEEVSNPWLWNDYGLDLSAGTRFIVNSWRKRTSKELDILSPAVIWGVIDYRTVTEPSLSGQVELIVDRDGVGHGISVWFDAEIADGLGFSNAPDQDRLVYSGAQFPWPEAVNLRCGDVVRLTMDARKTGTDYTWRWDTEIVSVKGSDFNQKCFRQSTFAGQLISPQQIAKTAEGYIPDLNQKGQVAAFVLQLMNGGLSVKEIADQLSTRFPEQYADKRKALEKAASFSLRFSS